MSIIRRSPAQLRRVCRYFMSAADCRFSEVAKSREDAASVGHHPTMSKRKHALVLGLLASDRSSRRPRRIFQPGEHRNKEKVMKVLMVITSHDQLGNTGRKTGFWLEELAAPYYGALPCRR